MSRQDLRTIQATNYKINVREERLMELLMQSFNKTVYEQSRLKDKATPAQKQIIAQLANWISVDCVDNHKWLMMLGGIGNGKTTVLKSLYYLIHWLSTTEGGRYIECVSHSYGFMTATDLCDIYKNDISAFRIFRDRHIVMLDDIGAEPQSQMNWGNEEHPVTEFLMYRYNRQLPVIMTTNLPPKIGDKSAFEARYGIRVRDRLNEMCGLIKFTDVSFR